MLDTIKLLKNDIPVNVYEYLCFLISKYRYTYEDLKNAGYSKYLNKPYNTI